MVDLMLSERILQTTRGRVLALLRRGSMTTDELAGALGLTDNAIRAHLATLERDGLVQLQGERRDGRIGKPATVYTVSPQVDTLFSKAYIPLLTSLLSALGDRLTAQELGGLLSDVGDRLATGTAHPSGELSQRATAASNLLNQLGGLSSVEEVEAGTRYNIQSCGCPLGVAVSERPEVCEAMVALISRLTSQTCARAARTAAGQAVASKYRRLNDLRGSGGELTGDSSRSRESEAEEFVRAMVIIRLSR